MIKHVALFNLKQQAAGATKDDNIETIFRNVERLKNDVPVNKRIEVSQQLERDRDLPWAADVVVSVEFESLDDYDFYLAHSVHRECAAFAASVSDHVEAITYESPTA